MASVLDLVKHYQHTIEKYPTDEHKVLKCIDKLFNLAVTVQHLQETGVGRTVNALRKESGDVGQAARALVYKWKLMVAAEESDQETDQNNDSSTQNGHGSGKDSDDSRTKSDRYERSNSSSKPKDHREINGDYSGSKRRYHSSEDEEPNNKRSKPSSSSEDDYKRKSHARVKKAESESDSHSDSDGSQSDGSDSEMSDSSQEEVKVKQEVKKEHSSHKSSSSKHSSHVGHADHKSSSSSRPLEPEKHSKHHSSHSKEKHSSEASLTKEKSHSSDKHKSSKEKDSHSEKKHKSDAEKSHKESKSRHSLEKQSSSDKHNSSDKHSSSDKNSSSDKHRLSSSHKSDSGPDKNKSSDKHSKSDKHKSSSHLHASEKEKHKSSSEKDSERAKHKVKESTSNSSSSKDKHSSSSKDKSKERSNSSKDKSSSHSSEKKHSSSSDHKSNSKGHSEKNDDKSDKKSKHKSSSSTLKSSKSSSSKVPKKKVQIQVTDEHDSDDGIDCGSGASFAEALGMISPAKSKKKLSKDIASPNNDYSPATMLAPTAKLAPLPALEISALPEISPNYKPRPPPRPLPHFSDEDAMNFVISSKNARTKVYSGNKVIGGKIPSLYEMCVNVLQEHIDALEYTGGVPYEILKPVVDRATPQQLFLLEHYNPYLMEDTDHLWQKFCQKNFRNKQRQENEAWREMYTRCQEEQEIRLKSLTNNIRIAQEAKKAPIKQTKMAYVDSIAKPPRNIAKKQAQHGTARMATGSPAARVAGLAAAPNVLRGGAVARALAPLPSSGSSSFKPKKAPLMAKALQIMRGRKR